METVRRRLRGLSLRKSILVYTVGFLLAALLLIGTTVQFCDYAGTRIEKKYLQQREKYYLTNSAGEQLGEGTYVYSDMLPYSSRDARLVGLFKVLPAVLVPVYSALCIVAGAFLFYRNRLQRPIAALALASEKIAASDLDFTVEYSGGDELGRLCESFETMRRALAENNARMWRQMEERKRLNAAFAHDLRTPLTVLKGYGEMLPAQTDAQALQATAVNRQIVRMEQYVESMSRLQKLEDKFPHIGCVDTQTLTETLRGMAKALCDASGRELVFSAHIFSAALLLDASFVEEVFDNLLSNAARYAGKEVRVEVWEKETSLWITAADDGEGFSAEGLKRAADPYYTQADDRQEHFGLGLYICRLLCEHHGGSLTIENLTRGCCVTAVFRIAERNPQKIEKK